MSKKKAVLAGYMMAAAFNEPSIIPQIEGIGSIHPRNKRNHGMTASEIKAKQKRRKKEKAARKQRKR